MNLKVLFLLIELVNSVIEYSKMCWKLSNIIIEFIKKTNKNLYKRICKSEKRK